MAWAQGEREEAFDEIERAVGFANQLGTLQLVRDASAQQARFWLKSNRLALAERWADSCDLDPYLPPEYERQIEHLTYVRLLMHQGRPDLALAILKRIDAARRGDRPARRSRGDPAPDGAGAQGQRQRRRGLQGAARGADAGQPGRATCAPSWTRRSAWQPSCATPRPASAIATTSRAILAEIAKAAVADPAGSDRTCRMRSASGRSRCCGWWRRGCPIATSGSSSSSARRRSRRT